MILGITAEGDEDENDKENMIRRREIMRNRLEKDSMFHEEEDRNRREGDIVSRWRDKRDSSPVHYRVCIFFYSLVLVFNDCLCVCVCVMVCYALKGDKMFPNLLVCEDKNKRNGIS